MLAKYMLCILLSLYFSAAVHSHPFQDKRYREAKQYFERGKELDLWCDPRAEQVYKIAIETRNGHYPEASLELSRHLARCQSRFSEAATALRDYIKHTRKVDHKQDFRDLENLDLAAKLQNELSSSEKPGLDDLLRLATLIVSYGKSDDSIAVLEKAVRLYPASSKANLMLASSLKSGQSQRILELLEKAIESAPNSPDVRAEAGWYYFSLVRQIDKAIAEFNRALELSNGQSVEAWRGLAYTLPFQGRKKEAIEAFRNYWRMRKGPSQGDELLRQRIEQLEKDS